jgi:hypothetical protein
MLRRIKHLSDRICPRCKQAAAEHHADSQGEQSGGVQVSHARCASVTFRPVHRAAAPAESAGALRAQRGCCGRRRTTTKGSMTR